MEHHSLFIGIKKYIILKGIYFVILKVEFKHITILITWTRETTHGKSSEKFIH